MLTINPAALEVSLQGLRKHRVVIALLGVIVLAATVIRLYPLSERSFWFDEAFTWRLIGFSWSEMFERAGRDNSPPFYYVLLKVWSEIFGTSPVALRSLSLIFGVLTVASTCLFCVEAFGRDLFWSVPSTKDPSSRTRGQGIGLLAAALVAVSALQIRYSWETRMYSLAALLTVASSWALLRALRPSSGWLEWLLYAGLAALLAYTHYYGLFTLAGHAVFAVFFLLVKAQWSLLAFCRMAQVRRSLVAAALAVAAWLPWLPVFVRQQAQVQDKFWSHPVSAWDLAELSYRMFTPGFAAVEFAQVPSQQTVLLIADGCLLGLWLLRRNGRAGDWFVLCSAVAPFLLCLLASRLGTHVLTLRYFVMAQLFLLIGMAALVFRIPHAFERSVLSTVILAALFLAALETYDNMDLPNRPGARAAAEYIERQRRPGEPVIVSSPLYYLPLLYHGKTPSGFFIYTDGDPIPHYRGTAVLSASELITQDRLEGLRSRRAWVVNMASGYWGTASVPVPGKWIEKSIQIFADMPGVGDFEVVEYEIRGEPPVPPKK